jgi:hypothetical protein
VVRVLEEQGHEVVPIARSVGVDVITTEGLAEALEGVESVIDAATGPSPEEQPATEFFTTAARNLQQFGEQAGVQRISVVSIIGIDRSTSGYGVAKQAHEQATLAGPVPAQILRAAQFHEFPSSWTGVARTAWSRAEMRTQLVAARTVAEALDRPARSRRRFRINSTPIREIAGPRGEENLAEMARLRIAPRRPGRIEEPAPADPDSQLQDGALSGPHATLAGPTFEEWLRGTR